MKLATYGDRWQERLGLVTADGKSLIDLNTASDGAIPADALGFLETGLWEAVREVAAQGTDVPSAALHALDTVRLGAPVPLPRNVICVGLNYRDHAEEGGRTAPEQPTLFMKASTCVIGPYDDIVLPRTIHHIDFEVEVAFIVGKGASGVTMEQAPDYIAGYTVFHDVSGRDAQFSDGQWFRGKSCDTFGPMGPYLVTPDEVGDPHVLDLWLTVNGEEMQHSNTRHLIFNMYHLLAYISENITLYPGDVVATGTPAGVGNFRAPAVFLKSGDVVELNVEKVGTIRNRVAGSR